MHRRSIYSAAMLSATQVLFGCAALQFELLEGERPPGMPAAPQKTTEIALRMHPLPGKLDQTLVFNSNSPEIVTRPGIVLSTLPAPNEQLKSTFQGVAFSGDFAIFSHHIARDPRPGTRRLHLGLIAHNRGKTLCKLGLRSGATYLSQPDALFRRLRPLLPDPTGTFFAGPGDRVAGEILRGLSPLKPREWSIPPGSNQLLLDFPIPTNVAFPPPINGRTTQLYMHSDAPIYVSEVAVFANSSSPSDFVSPSKEDFQSVLSKNTRAGALEAPATPLVEGKEIKKGFRYGRVAGVTRGATWNSNLSREVAPLAPGETVGFPISAVHLNRLGTQQVQSAPLTSRYPESAYQGHGNYGVRYEMVLRLENPSPEPRAYALALSHPTQVTSQGGHHVATFRTPPDKAVTFRGLLRVDEWIGTRTLPPRFTHIVLRRGQTLPPFETLAIAAQGRRDLTLSLIYPADATPPQLLTIQRI